MNDLPRQKLCEIIIQYGQSVYNNPKRCEGLLRDFCGQYRKEIAVLVGALKDGVPDQLQASKNSVPHVILLTQLSKRLQDNLGFSEESATWAVESWALALRVVPLDNLSKPKKEPSHSEEANHQNQNSAKVNTLTQPTQNPTPPQVTTSAMPVVFFDAQGGIQNPTAPQPQVTPLVTHTNQQPFVKLQTQPPVTTTKPPATQLSSTRQNKKAIAIGAVVILALLGGLVYSQEQRGRQEAESRLEANDRQQKEMENQLAEEQRKRQEAESQLEADRQKKEPTVTNLPALDPTLVFSCSAEGIIVKVSSLNSRTLRYSAYNTPTTFQRPNIVIDGGIEDNQNGETVYRFPNGNYLYAVYKDSGNDRIEVYQDNRLISKLDCQ